MQACRFIDASAMPLWWADLLILTWTTFASSTYQSCTATFARCYCCSNDVSHRSCSADALRVPDALLGKNGNDRYLGLSLDFVLQLLPGHVTAVWKQFEKSRAPTFLNNICQGIIYDLHRITNLLPAHLPVEVMRALQDIASLCLSDVMILWAQLQECDVRRSEMSLHRIPEAGPKESLHH